MTFLRFKYLFFFFLLAACSGTDPVDKEQVEKEINEALRLQQAAWNEGDLDGFVAWYISGSSLRFTSPRGLVKGSDKLLERYQDSYPTPELMGVLNFEVMEFEVLDNDHAVVIGQWLLTRDNGRVDGYFTLVWKRTADGWRIAIDHTS